MHQEHGYVWELVAMMDAIDLILTALGSGAAAAAKDTVSVAFKDSYEELKAMIRRRLTRADEEHRSATIDEIGSDELPARLRAAGLDRDEAVIAVARALLENIDPIGARAGKYDVHISGGKGIVVGDHT